MSTAFDRTTDNLGDVDAIESALLNISGWGARDSGFAFSLADQIRRGRRLTDRQRYAAYHMLGNYRPQLERIGIDFAKIPEPAIPPPKASQRTIELDADGKRFAVRFAYDAALVAAMRTIPEREWNKERGAWLVEATEEGIRMLAAFAERYGFTASPTASALLGEAIRLASEARAVSAARIEASNAAAADLDIPGLGAELYPFQKAGVKYAIEARRTFIADQMGLGKTPQSLATVHVLGAYPAVVVCPASLKLNWQREARKWLPGKRIRVLNGRAKTEDTTANLLFADAYTADLLILNYEILPSWVPTLRAWGVQVAIFDEAHYIKTEGAARTKAAMALTLGLPTILLLTGTPVLNRPEELVAQLRVMHRIADPYKRATADQISNISDFKSRYVYVDERSRSAALQDLNERMRAMCLRYDTVLATEEGPRTIREIVREGRPIRVWSHSVVRGPELRRALGFRESSRHEALVRVHHEFGSVDCTADHLVWTTRGYVRADTLGRDDHLLVLRPAQNTSLVGTEARYPSLLLPAMRDPRRDAAHGARTPKDRASAEAVGISSEEGHPSLTRVCGEGTRNMEGAPPRATSADKTHLLTGTGASRAFGMAVGVAGVLPDRQSAGRQVHAGRPLLPVARSRASSEQNSHRDRRIDASPAAPASTGPVEVGAARFARVDRVAVLQPRRDGPPRANRPDDLVYDIEVEENENFYANGVLVHNCFIRRTKAQVLTELPAKQHVTIPIEIDNRDEYMDAESELVKMLLKTDPAQARKSLYVEHIAQIEALKQLVVKGKMAAMEEWITDFLETGEKLVLFGWHQKSIRAVAEKYAAPTITGSTSLLVRDEAVQRFQTDERCKLIVCNMQAGGVGLTLTAASNVAFMEQGWNGATHLQAEDRVHRIGQTDSVTAYYLLAPQTIDERIRHLIEAKQVVVDETTEGRFGPTGGGSILADLIADLTGKQVQE